MDPVMEELQKLEADQPLLSKMFPVISNPIQHAKTFSKDHPQLASTHGVDALADVESSDAEFNELSLETSLVSVLQSRLEDFYMKDCMIAAYMMNAANFMTSNNGLTYQLPWPPWDTLSDDDMNRFTDEAERLGA
jgi:hypothetical protein